MEGRLENSKTYVSEKITVRTTADGTLATESLRKAGAYEKLQKVVIRQKNEKRKRVLASRKKNDWEGNFNFLSQQHAKKTSA